MREDTLKYFREELAPIIKNGADIWEDYVKNPSGETKEILQSIRDTKEELEFLSAFAYYLSTKAIHENNGEHHQIIEALLEKENDGRNSDAICIMLSSILFSDDPNIDNGAVISDHIIALYKEIVLHQEDFTHIYSMTSNKSTPKPDIPLYCWYLCRVLRFVSQVCPAYFAKENTYLSNPAFCVAVLADFRNEANSIPATSFMYNGLRIADPGCFCYTARRCYHFKMDSMDYQGAYDILYSWVNKKMVGEFKHIDRVFTLEDDAWRNDNPSWTIHMYTILSCLCSAIADMHSTASKQYAFFRDYSTQLATYHQNPENTSLSTSILKAHALINNRKYTEAKQIALSALDNPKFTIEERKEKLPINKKQTILLSSIISCAGILCNPNASNSADYNHNNTQLVQLIREFVAIGADFRGGQIYNTTAVLISRIFEHEKTQKLLSDEIIASLLCIQQLVPEIQRELRYDKCLKTKYITHNLDIDQSEEPPERNCPPIAYYTTLNNLKYLLEPVYADNHRCKPEPLSALQPKPDVLKAKNCLTMMHAHYMNDPREGITLLESLSDDIDKNSSIKNILFPKSYPTVFREQIFDNQFVFLKSFTDLVDQLNMWSVYGSDRSENTDSNGCCISIAPESFEMMLSISHLTHVLRDPDDNHDTDDLRLYKVAYVQNGKLCTGTSSLLVHYYAKLKVYVRQLNKVLTKIKNETERQQLTEFITSILQELLTPIIFLFKDSSYQAEKELRLIITRSRIKEDMKRISKTPQHPPKLYVNPYHQVFIEQIILGPKVNKPDEWIPHLQYELTEMWEKWPAKNGEKRVPSVRKSSINYRD